MLATNCSCSDDIGSQDKPVSASDGTDSRPLNDWFGDHGWESRNWPGLTGLADVGCMAIRRDRQVQGDAIASSRTRPRPKPGI